jgi:ADP-heptose:LPS heptosyltransferase
MTTPLLEVIQQHYPNAHITYVVGSWSKVIAEHHPAVQEVLDCGTVGISGRYPLSDYMKFARQLRQHHFDLAFVLDRSPMLTLLPWLANIPRRVGPDSLGRGFSLTDRVPVSTSRTQLQHQADIYLDLARALQLPIDHPRMRFVPTEAERAGIQLPANPVKTPETSVGTGQAQSTVPTAPVRSWGPHIYQADSDVPSTHFRTGASPVPTVGESHVRGRVAVFPGGGSNPGMELTAKRWSLDGYREIVRRLVQDLHMQVLLIGGKEDFELNESLLVPLDVPPGSVLNLAGQTQFGQTAAYLESCALFIGNDSSPMHLAAAVGTPVVAIFGPTSPQEYGPYPPDDHKHIAIWRHPTGQPCFFLGKMQTCEHCTCMSSVTVEDVWNAVQRLITQNQHIEAKS